MSPTPLFRRYGAILGVFALIQLAVVTVPPNEEIANWTIVCGYLVAAGFAAISRAWFATLVASSVVVVRTLLALGITGLPFRAASAVFATLFFLLIIVEVEWRRLARHPLIDCAEFLVDSHSGTISNATDEANALFRCELDGRNINEFIPDELRGAHAKHVKDFMSAGLARTMGHVPPVTALRADGEKFQALIGLAPAGRHVGVVVQEWRPGP